MPSDPLREKLPDCCYWQLAAFRDEIGNHVLDDDPEIDPEVPAFAAKRQRDKKRRQAQGWNRAIKHVQGQVDALIEGRR